MSGLSHLKYLFNLIARLSFDRSRRADTRNDDTAHQPRSENEIRITTNQMRGTL